MPLTKPERYHVITILQQEGIPCIIWAEDANRQFGCRVLVGHLFLIVKDPRASVECLLACGKYARTSTSWAYGGEGPLEHAPSVLNLENDQLVVSFLQRSRYSYLLFSGYVHRRRIPYFHCASLSGSPIYMKPEDTQA